MAPGSCSHEADPPRIELANALTMLWIAWLGAFVSADPVLSVTAYMFWLASTIYHYTNSLTESYHTALHRLDVAAHGLCVMTCVLVSDHPPRLLKALYCTTAGAVSAAGLLLLSKRSHVSAVAFVYNAPALVIVLAYGRDRTTVSLFAMLVSASLVVACKVFEGRVRWLWPASRLPSAIYAYCFWHAMGICRTAWLPFFRRAR